MASIPFDYQCDRESGFVQDPNSHNRVGYITALDGLGLTHPATPDLTVSIPYSGQPNYPGITFTQPGEGNLPRTSSVVGVIEQLSWEGGVGDPIAIDFWCSQENATKIKALQQSVLTTTKVNQLGWWIIDFDQETKVWFEQSYPATGAITGSISGKDDPALDVDLTPVPAKDGIDVNVYKITISVAPAANLQFALAFANSAEKQVVKSWGLVVGTLASDPTSAA
jgi:hypothetical protein